MSAFYAFGSGMLEQSLENKKAAAERKFELVKQIAPYALQNIDEQRKLLQAEKETDDTLANVYTQGQRNVLYSLNKNLLYSKNPLEDAQALVQGFGADQTSALEAFNAAAETAEFDSGTQEQYDNYIDIYTNDIASQLGVGKSTIDLQLGLRGMPNAEEPAPDMQPVEGEAMPMEQTVPTTPPLASLAFGGGEADPFIDTDAGKVAKIDFDNDPQSKVTRFEQWLQTPVDQNGNVLGGFDEPGAMTRKLLYKLEDQADKQGTTVGSDIAMGEATIDVEGVLELTPAMISDIQNRLASGDAQAISEAKQTLIDAGIPYADRFPELNDY
jgi:hypothetical protein